MRKVGKDDVVAYLPCLNKCRDPDAVMRTMSESRESNGHTLTLHYNQRGMIPIIELKEEGG